MSSVLVDREDGVLKITLNRPHVKNGLTREMRLALAAALTDTNIEDRVIVIRGADGAFCSGQDLSEFIAMGDEGDMDEVDAKTILAEEYEPILDAIEDSDIPVIAAVEGAAAGAGMSLALACDVIIAADSAFFQLAFSKIGLVPDVAASYHLPRLVGRARAMGMALFAERISAEEAQHMGMIWRAVPDHELEAELERHLTQIVEGPKMSYRFIRQMMRQSLDADYAGQLDFEGDAQKIALRSDDFAEGVAAFMQKRRPYFS